MNLIELIELIELIKFINLFFFSNNLCLNH